MKKLKLFKFKYMDTGYCRAYFTFERKLYCLQGIGKLEFLSCSRDGEPCCSVDLKEKVWMEIPDIEEMNGEAELQLQQDCLNFIMEHPMLQGLP